MFELLRQAREYNIPARYLLFDSWFSFPSVIRKVRECGLHVVCMLKSIVNATYLMVFPISDDTLGSGVCSSNHSRFHLPQGRWDERTGG